MRRGLQLNREALFKDNSCSTLDSSPRNQPIRLNKEKSQLCKKFMEFGYCPYGKRCKFAHGSHELRKNQQPNSKYKTKVCGVFLHEGHCMYGERCNFIHPSVRLKRSAVMDAGFREVKAGGRLSSRLLTLLNSSRQL